MIRPGHRSSAILLCSLALGLLRAAVSLADPGLPGSAGTASPAPKEIAILASAGAADLRTADGRKASVQALDLQASGLAELRRAGRGRVTVPLPAGGEVSLLLEEQSIFSPGARWALSGAEQDAALLDLRLYRATAPDDSTTWGVIGVSGGTVVGSLHAADRSWAILPPEMSFGVGRALVIDETDLPAPLPGLGCGAEELDPLIESAATRPAAPATSTDRLVGRIAVDVDYDAFSYVFQFDQAVATTYLTTMMGTVSAVYERDLNITLELSYLNIWTYAADPYNVSDGGGQLSQFSSWWNANRGSITRDLALLVSGRGYADVAGIAYMNGICNNAYGYALVSMTSATETYPVNQVSWNVSLTAHELGHGFGSAHTHSCYWSQNGYAPVGTLLDSCYAAEGNCYTGPSGVLASGKGTIMSYCHLLGSVSQTLRLDFHPACAQRMRQVAESICPIDVAVVQPPTGLAVTTGPGGAVLNWTASVTPNVSGYNVYASVYRDDWNPPLLGYSPTTSYTPLPVGSYYFRVKALRPPDSSPLSQSVRGASCSFAATDSPVTLPGELCAGDFDEDGILDLAVVAGSPKVLMVMHGQGSGGEGSGAWGSAVSYPAGPSPAAVTTDDFNDDGILDLAVASWASPAGTPGTVQILLGQGSGGTGNGAFLPAVAITTIKDPAEIVTGDFNEDGVIDIAVSGGFPGRVGVHLGAGSSGIGTGGFGAVVSYLGLSTRPKGLVTGDYNEDGIPDLAVGYRGPAGDNEARVQVLEGQGSGGHGNGLFVANPIYALVAFQIQSLYGIRSADFNDDGRPDFVVASDTLSSDGLRPRLSVSLNLGGGLFDIGRNSDVGGTALVSMAVADWNQDGRPDVMVTNNETQQTPSVALLYGGAGAGFGPPLRFGDGATEGKKILAGDFNEDDVPDGLVSLASRLSMLKSLCATTPAGELTLVSPDGGQAWSPGDERTITWAKGVGVMAVDLQLSRDGGQQWETIARNQPGNSFTWTVTLPNTSQALVRVVDSTLSNRRDESGTTFYIGPVSGVEEPPVAAGGLRIVGVHPNPFRDRVTLTLEAADSGPIEWAVLDVQGRVVHQDRHDVTAPGRVDIVWDGRTDSGESAASGVYYARLAQGGRPIVRTVMLAR